MPQSSADPHEHQTPRTRSRSRALAAAAQQPIPIGHVEVSHPSSSAPRDPASSETQEDRLSVQGVDETLQPPTEPAQDQPPVPAPPVADLPMPRRRGCTRVTCSILSVVGFAVVVALALADLSVLTGLESRPAQQFITTGSPDFDHETCVARSLCT